jgi:hypothetical protein
MTDDIRAAHTKVVPNDIKRRFEEQLPIIRRDESVGAGIARLVEQCAGEEGGQNDTVV